MEEVIKEDTISLIRMRFSIQTQDKCSLQFKYADKRGNRTLHNVPIATIDDERLIKDGKIQLPTKIFITSTDHAELLFYTGDCLPPSSRPFTEKLYVAFFKVDTEDGVDSTLEYRASDRMLIDQIMVNDTLWYIFVFDVNTADNILV